MARIVSLPSDNDFYDPEHHGNVFFTIFLYRRYAVCFFAPPLHLPSRHWGSPQGFPLGDRTMTTFRYDNDGLFDDTLLETIGAEDLWMRIRQIVVAWPLMVMAYQVGLVTVEAATNKTKYSTMFFCDSGMISKLVNSC